MVCREGRSPSSKGKRPLSQWAGRMSKTERLWQRICPSHCPKTCWTRVFQRRPYCTACRCLTATWVPHWAPKDPLSSNLLSTKRRIRFKCLREGRCVQKSHGLGLFCEVVNRKSGRGIVGTRKTSLMTSETNLRFVLLPQTIVIHWSL